MLRCSGCAFMLCIWDARGEITRFGCAERSHDDSAPIVVHAQILTQTPGNVHYFVQYMREFA